MMLPVRRFVERSFQTRGLEVEYDPESPAFKLKNKLSTEVAATGCFTTHSGNIAIHTTSARRRAAHPVRRPSVAVTCNLPLHLSLELDSRKGFCSAQNESLPRQTLELPLPLSATHLIVHQATRAPVTRQRMLSVTHPVTTATACYSAMTTLS